MKTKIIFMLSGILLINSGQLVFSGQVTDGIQAGENIDKQEVRKNYETYMVKMIQQCMGNLDEILLDLIGENGKASKDGAIAESLPRHLFQKVEDICLKISNVRPILSDSENAIRSKNKVELKDASNDLEEAAWILQGCYEKLKRISESNGNGMDCMLKTVDLVAQRVAKFPTAIEGLIELS